MIQIQQNARKVADYMVTLNLISPLSFEPCSFRYYHMGALLTDVILQSGLNYNNVVKPRIEKILNNYPQARTVSLFEEEIKKSSIEKIINWQHPEKIRRLFALINTLTYFEINTEDELRNFLLIQDNHSFLLCINGFGPKSLDYMLKLLDVPVIAVDRHIINFIEQAGLKLTNYTEIKKTVEFAADLLQLNRSIADKLIWEYMSNKKGHENLRLFS